MRTLRTQKERVIEQLNTYGVVDNFWAIQNYILRLGAIILILKHEGWEFDTFYGEGRNEKNYHYRLRARPIKKYKTYNVLNNDGTVDKQVQFPIR